jgi:hypothetical protein
MTSKSYYEEYKRLAEFVEMVSDNTQEWDDLCDCPCNDGLSDGNHDPKCRTMNLRKDENYAWNGVRE